MARYPWIVVDLVVVSTFVRLVAEEMNRLVFGPANLLLLF